MSKRTVTGLIAGIGLAAVISAAMSGSVGITSAGASLNKSGKSDGASLNGASLNGASLN